MLWLLAQAQIPNVTDWATYGLAGLILVWLFFWHLPSKDIQLKEKDKLLMDVVLAHTEHVKVLVESNARQINTILESNNQEREKDRVARHDMSNRLQVATAQVQERNEAMIAQQATSFLSSIDKVLSHCNAETSRFVDLFREWMDTDRSGGMDTRPS